MKEVIPAYHFSDNLLTQYESWLDRAATTMTTYRNCLRQFAAWLRYSSINQPLKEDVAAWRDYLLSEHDAIMLADTPTGWQYRYADGHRIRTRCKPATAALYLVAVKQFFQWTDEAGLYPDITKSIRTPKIQKGYRKDALAREDVTAIEQMMLSRIRNATTPIREEQERRLYALFLLAVNAGLRNVELSRARIRDLEEVKGRPSLYVWSKGHSGADEKKPLAPEVYQALKDYLGSRKDNPTASAPLFAATGNRSGGQALDPRTISSMLKSLLKAAGYDSERLTAHSLRHTAGTSVMTITGDLYATQNYMRHQNPATTEIYLHLDQEQANADAARRLYEYYHPEGHTDQAELPAPTRPKIIDGSFSNGRGGLLFFEIDGLVRHRKIILDCQRQELYVVYQGHRYYESDFIESE